MFNEVACARCGEWFVRKGNQEYCCKECSDLAKKEAERKRKQKKRQKKNGAKYPSIDDMVRMAMELSKESGKLVQYGDVQKMLYTGKLKVKDGAFV